MFPPPLTFHQHGHDGMPFEQAGRQSTSRVPGFRHRVEGKSMAGADDFLAIF
jgi:hypothetical protein